MYMSGSILYLREVLILQEKRVALLESSEVIEKRKETLERSYEHFKKMWN